MSHTYKSTIKGDDTTITVDESHDQLPDPSRWAEVVKLTAAEKKAKAEKEAAAAKAKADAEEAEAKKAEAEKAAAAKAEADAAK